MFSLLVTILFVSAVGVAAVFFMIAEDLNLPSQNPSRTQSLLIVTREANLIKTKEQLEIELELLKATLSEKQRVLAKSKENISLILQKLNKMLKTRHEYHKCYSHLKCGIEQAEEECDHIKRKIGEYSRWDRRMRTEAMLSEEKCQKLLEVFKPSQSDNGSVEFCQEKIDDLLKLLENSAEFGENNV